MSRKLPDNDELRRLYVDEERTGYEIAEMFEVHHQTVYTALSLAGIRRESGRPEPCWKREIPPRELIERLIAEDLSKRAIARILQCDHRTLQGWIEAHGIQVPERESRHDVAEDALRLLFCEYRLTLAEISLVMGVSEGVIASRLKEIGLGKFTGRCFGKANRRPTPDQLRQLFSLGLTNDQVARVYDVPVATLRDWKRAWKI